MLTAESVVDIIIRTDLENKDQVRLVLQNILDIKHVIVHQMDLKQMKVSDVRKFLKNRLS